MTIRERRNAESYTQYDMESELNINVHAGRYGRLISEQINLSTFLRIFFDTPR